MSGLCSFTLNPCFSLLDFPVRREHWTEVNMTWMLLLPQQHAAVSTTCWPADVLRCNSRPIFIHKKGNPDNPGAHGDDCTQFELEL